MRLILYNKTYYFYIWVKILVHSTVKYHLFTIGFFVVVTLLYKLFITVFKHLLVELTPTCRMNFELYLHYVIRVRSTIHVLSCDDIGLKSASGSPWKSSFGNLKLAIEHKTLRCSECVQLWNMGTDVVSKAAKQKSQFTVQM